MATVWTSRNIVVVGFSGSLVGGGSDRTIWHAGSRSSAEGEGIEDNHFPRNSFCEQIVDASMTPENPLSDNFIDDWDEECLGWDD